MTGITQADRDMAADFLESWEPGPEMTVVKLAKAFARHRQQAAAEERAKIVAWLRGFATNYADDLADILEADKTFTRPSDT